VVAVRTLDAKEEAAYLIRACGALSAARLNAHYSPARAASFHLRCMGAGVHGGLYEPLQLDLRSGLPSYREWVRVLTDAAVAAGSLAALPEEQVLAARARAAPHGIHGKTWIKAAYYRALLAQPLLEIDRASVVLRRVDPATRTAFFTIVLDKLDASGCLIRYTVELAQQDAFWRRPIVELDASSTRLTEELQAIVYRFASVDAELTFGRLAEHPHVRVERVTRGCIGPLFAAPMRAPDALRALLADPAAWIATFSLDVAATDLATDCDNDPLDTWLGDQLSAPARAEYEAARARFGYKVFKDRKFVAPAQLEQALASLCERKGTRNIVYAVS
jgi:hypothetical protein